MYVRGYQNESALERMLDWIHSEKTSFQTDSLLILVCIQKKKPHANRKWHV